MKHVLLTRHLCNCGEDVFFHFVLGSAPSHAYACPHCLHVVAFEMPATLERVSRYGTSIAAFGDVRVCVEDGCTGVSRFFDNLRVPSSDPDRAPRAPQWAHSPALGVWHRRSISESARVRN